MIKKDRTLSLTELNEKLEKIDETLKNLVDYQNDVITPSLNRKPVSECDKVKTHNDWEKYENENEDTCTGDECTDEKCVKECGTKKHLKEKVNMIRRRNLREQRTNRSARRSRVNERLERRARVREILERREARLDAIKSRRASRLNEARKTRRTVNESLQNRIARRQRIREILERRERIARREKLNESISRRKRVNALLERRQNRLSSLKNKRINEGRRFLKKK
jgi:hypothetical protein